MSRNFAGFEEVHLRCDECVGDLVTSLENFIRGEFEWAKHEKKQIDVVTRSRDLQLEI